MEYNVYCDESCHLKSNDSNYMLIGAMYCPKNKIKKINNDIKAIKTKYLISNGVELKWNKISKKTEELYIDLIKYFFETADLKFRAIVINKSTLDHKKFNQTENDFYHKSYYEMLRYIIAPENSYNIYPDIKDTHSYYSFQITLKYLRIKISDSNQKTIKKIQPIKSYESQILQLNDIFLGALSYYYRNLNSNDSKNKVVSTIKKLYDGDLNVNSYYNNTKFNILKWRSKYEYINYDQML